MKELKKESAPSALRSQWLFRDYPPIDDVDPKTGRGKRYEPHPAPNAINLLNEAIKPAPNGVHNPIDIITDFLTSYEEPLAKAVFG